MLELLAQTYNYGSSYGSSGSSGSSTMSSTEAGIFTASVFVFVFIIFIVIWLLIAIPTWKIFNKAGRTGWHALIPIYSQWVLFEISGKPGYWALAGFIPFVGSVLSVAAMVVAMLQLAKNFGKDTTFAVLWLIIFSIVGLYILAFGDAKYLGSEATGAESGSVPSLGTPQPNLTQNTPPASNISSPNAQPPMQPSASSVPTQPTTNGAQPPNSPSQNPPTV